MSNSFVFILGAGASAESGAPLMNGFLQQAELVQGQFNIITDTDLIEDYDLVRQGRAALQRVHSKAKFDIHNLESVFAAFEMATLMDELPSLTKQQVRRLVPAMARVITATLEQTMVFDVFGEAIHPHESYHQFGFLLKGLLDRKNRVAVLTFNYDIGLEVALQAAGLEPRYGIGDGSQTPGDGVELLKLHGSLNWTACKKRHIHTMRVADVVEDMKRHWKRVGTWPEQTRVVITDRLSGLNRCGHPCSSEPVIVPPTANKAGFHRELQPVWKLAATRLREADNVIVCGYSWPRGDHFFQQLYALGTASERLIRRFLVYDIDAAVRDRFRNELLGEQAAACFGPPDKTDLFPFSRASAAIAELFNVTLPLRPTRPAKKRQPEYQVGIFGGRGGSNDWMSS